MSRSKYLLEHELVRTLREQFLVAESGNSESDLFSHRVELGSYTVLHSVRNARPLICDGRTVGVVLGHAVLKSGEDGVSSPIVLPCEVTGSDCWRALDYFHESFLGHYIVVLLAGGDLRIFQDPMGTYGCVYDVESGRVASSAFALFSTIAAYNARLDMALVSRNNYDADDWLPAGLTAHRGVQRLLPNHVLDVSNLRIARGWPRAPVGSAPSLEETARAMTSVCAKAALIGPVYVPLTAGLDSRTVLGLVKAARLNPAAFTLRVNDGLDAAMAAKLMVLAGGEHRIIPVDVADWEAQVRYLYRNGHGAGGENMRIHPSLGHFNPGQVFLSGTGGEAARAFYWQKKDKASSRISAKAILDRMKLSGTPPMVEAMERWLRSLEHLDHYVMLDLAYVELRMGCWASNHRYAQLGHPTVISPFNLREFITYSLASPPELRREGGVHRQILEATWPRALSLPINKYGDSRDWMRFLTRVRRKLRAERVVRQARQVRAIFRG